MGLFNNVRVVRETDGFAGESTNHVGISSRALVGFLAVLLTLSFITLIGSILLGFSTGDRLLHPNPFVGYEALWPGQSIASVAAFAERTPEGRMACITGVSPSERYLGLDITVIAASSDQTDKTISCRYFPKDGGFNKTFVIIDADRVQEVQLFANSLPEDALLLYWGAPDSITKGHDQFMYLRWDHSTYIATAQVAEPDSVVKCVTLIAVW
jgi:hypothetical protein